MDSRMTTYKYLALGEKAFGEPFQSFEIKQKTWLATRQYQTNYSHRSSSTVTKELNSLLLLKV